MAGRDTAEAYIERLLEDGDLQSDLRELVAAIRGGFDRADAKKRKPSRLLDDRRFQRHAQRAVASFKEASTRLRGDTPKSHRGRRIVVAVLALGGGALAAREILREPGPDAPWG
jgi:hypothetical protein